MLKKLKLNGSMKTYPTEWLHFHFSLSCIGEGNSNPLQCSCLENPRDGGNPSGLPSMGSHGVGHDWGDLAWRPTRPSRSNTQKRCLFHHRGVECKNKKSRDTWSNSLIWTWSTKWSRAKANRVLPRECTDHVPSSNNIRDDSTQGHYQMVSTKINYNQQKQGQGLTVAQIMSSLLPNSDWNWRK